MSAIEHWADAPDAYAHRHTPLDALDPLMEKGSASRRANRRGFSFTPFLIDPDQVAAVQGRGFALLATAIESPAFPVVKRAVDSLDRVLPAPQAPRLEVPDAALVKRWQPVRLQALDLLRRAATTAHPLAAFAVREIFARHARYGCDDPVREAAKAALAEVANSYELRLARSICETPSADDDEERAPDGAIDWRAVERRQADERRAVAGELLSRHPKPAAAAAAFEALVTAASAAGIERQTYAFWPALVEASSAAAVAIADRVVAGRHPTLVPTVDAGTRAIAESTKVPSAAAQRLLSWAAESKDRDTRRAAALSFRHRKWPSPPTGATLRTFRSLLADPDETVRCCAVGAVRWVALAGHTALALHLLDAVAFGRNGRLAAEAASILIDGPPPRGPLGLAAVSDAQLQRMMGQLADVDAVEDHHLLKLLEALAGRLPSDLMNLLIARLSRDRAERSRRRRALAARVKGHGPARRGSAAVRLAMRTYRSFPYHWQRASLKALTAAKDYPLLIRRLRDQASLPTGDVLSLPKVFALASGGAMAPEAQEALLEWVESGDSKKLIAATTLVREAGTSFIFEQTDFVRRAVAAARSAGGDVQRSVIGSLATSANGGIIFSETTAPGQPSPKAESLRNRATAAAQAAPVGSAERDFYERIATGTQNRIDGALREDEEAEMDDY